MRYAKEAIRHGLEAGDELTQTKPSVDFERGNPTQWPAAYANSIQGAVAVGATGRDRERAYYSSTGPYLELVAPGGNQRIGGTTPGIVQQTYDFAFTDTFINGPAGYGPPRFDVFSYQLLQGTSM